ncbi:hypothetical protein HUU42_08185 [bacterium]|nr:hypothetical protein [bacterium]
MDILFLKRTFGIPSLNYCLLGRWLLHMSTGLLALFPGFRFPSRS